MGRAATTGLLSSLLRDSCGDDDDDELTDSIPVFDSREAFTPIFVVSASFGHSFPSSRTSFSVSFGFFRCASFVTHLNRFCRLRENPFWNIFSASGWRVQ